MGKFQPLLRNFSNHKMGKNLSGNDGDISLCYRKLAHKKRKRQDTSKEEKNYEF